MRRANTGRLGGLVNLFALLARIRLMVNGGELWKYGSAQLVSWISVRGWYIVSASENISCLDRTHSRNFPRTMIISVVVFGNGSGFYINVSVSRMVNCLASSMQQKFLQAERERTFRIQHKPTLILKAQVHCDC